MPIRICRRCGALKSLEQFPKRAGDPCLECGRKAAQGRPHTGSAGKPDPAKRRAREQARKAVRRGDIAVPLHCEQCREPKERKALQMHHDDHRFPLAVQWLCRGCHGRLQRRDA